MHSAPPTATLHLIPREGLQVLCVLRPSAHPSASDSSASSALLCIHPEPPCTKAQHLHPGHPPGSILSVRSFLRFWLEMKRRPSAEETGSVHGESWPRPPALSVHVLVDLRASSLGKATRGCRVKFTSPGRCSSCGPRSPTCPKTAASCLSHSLLSVFLSSLLPTFPPSLPPSIPSSLPSSFFLSPSLSQSLPSSFSSFFLRLTWNYVAQASL